MSRTQFRRGAVPIGEAAPPIDVYDALDRLDAVVISEKGGEIQHTCPDCDSDYARTNSETALYFCPCGWQGKHWLGSSSNGHGKAAPSFDIEPIWGEGIEPSPSVVDRWDYLDKHGNVVQTIHRQEETVYDRESDVVYNLDGTVKKRKSFPVSRIKDGRCIWAQPAKWQQVPYRLPELLKNTEATVWVAEGEKDADSLAAQGLVATCEAGYVANSKEAGRTLVHCLEGRDVKLVADRDPVGLKKALALKDALERHDNTVDILLPAVGKDVSDHLFNGYGVDELLPYETFLQGHPRDRLQESSDGLIWFTGADTPELVITNWIAYPLVASETRTLMVADPKAGKTTYLLAMAAAVSQGTDFLEQETIKQPVVYLSEQNHSTIFAQYPPRLIGNADFHLLCYPHNFGKRWPEFIRGGVEKCQEVGSRIMIIDTAQKFAQLDEGKNNDDGAVGKVLDELDYAQALGISVIVAKHERKSGGNLSVSAAGSYAWTAWPDILIGIREVDGNPNHRRVENKGRLQDAQGVWTVEYSRETRELKMLGDHSDVAKETARDKIIEWMGQDPDREWERASLIAGTELSPDTLDSAISRSPELFQ
jgi:AAA domain